MGSELVVCEGLPSTSLLKCVGSSRSLRHTQQEIDSHERDTSASCIVGDV